jgi:hypothetical protein
VEFFYTMIGVDAQRCGKMKTGLWGVVGEWPGHMTSSALYLWRILKD